MFDRFHSRARCVCCVVGPAVEEGVAVLHDGDGFPGEVVAGVGEEGEDEDRCSEHQLLPSDRERTQAERPQQGNSGNYSGHRELR